METTIWGLGFRIYESEADSDYLRMVCSKIAQRHRHAGISTLSEATQKELLIRGSGFRCLTISHTLFSAAICWSSTGHEVWRSHTSTSQLLRSALAMTSSLSLEAASYYIPTP